MKHIIITIVLVILCATLKWVAERWWHNAQRFVLPLLICAAIYFDFHYRLVSATPLLAIAAFIMGYKIYGKSDFWDRFLWLMDCEVLLWLGCVVLNHLDWRIYLIAVAVSGVWGALTRKFNNNWVAPLSGVFLGVVYFFVH